MKRTLPTPWKPTKAQLLPRKQARPGSHRQRPHCALRRHQPRPLHRRHRPPLRTPRQPFLARTPLRRLHSRLFSPFEGSLLLDLKFGITNVVQRATARADELTVDELRPGGRPRSQSQTLAPHRRRLRRHRPLPHRLRHKRCPRRPAKGRLRRQPRLGPSQPERPQRPLPARRPRPTLRRPPPLGHCAARPPLKKASQFPVSNRLMVSSARRRRVGGPRNDPHGRTRPTICASHDARQVTTDVQARYFGIKMNDQSLTPGDHPRIGPTRFGDWLDRSASATPDRPHTVREQLASQ